ncbi:unnamed protein product [Calypogeia fissa]
MGEKATLGSQTRENDEKQWSVYIGESKLERPVEARPQAVQICWWGMTGGQQRSHGGTIRGPAGGGLPGPSKASSVRGWIGMLNQIKGRVSAGNTSKQGGWATSEKGDTGTGGEHRTFRGGQPQTKHQVAKLDPIQGGVLGRSTCNLE